MSGASLASGNSDHTGVIKRLRSSLAPTTRDTPDFNATTSPRLDSRLARRPQPQFPYAIQPFQLLPASPEERDQVSVEEANRRIQQARALSVRQQRFGQLLELASAGPFFPKKPDWTLCSKSMTSLPFLRRRKCRDCRSKFGSICNTRLWTIENSFSDTWSFHITVVQLFAPKFHWFVFSHDVSHCSRLKKSRYGL